MFGLFRLVRKSLVDSGSLRRYVLYALGEISLVVIGILIALQVNNWNADKKDAKEALIVLHDLRREFDTNKIKLLELISNKESILSQWDSLINNVIYVPNYQISRIEIPLSVGTRRWNPVLGAFNTLISTGKIDLIKDNNIKYTILDWRDLIKSYLEDESLHIHFVNNELFPLENKLMPFSILLFQYKAMDHLVDRNLIRAAYKNIEYKNLLGRNRYYLMSNLNSEKELLKKMDLIIEQLDELINPDSSGI